MIRLPHLLVLVSSLAAALAAPLHARQTADGETVLVVSGEDISWETYAAWLLEARGEGKLKLFSEHQLLLRGAEAAGLAPDAAAIDARIEAEIAERVARAFDGDPAGWEAEIAAARRTPAGYFQRRRTELAYQMAADALVVQRRDPTPEDLRSAWERRHGEGGIRQRIQHLRLSLPRLRPSGDEQADQQRLTRDRAQVLDRARMLRERWLAGESFEVLVRELGGGSRPGATAVLDFRPTIWPAHAVQAVAALEAGAITEPLEARGTLNVFRLEERVTTPFDSVAEDLRREIVNAVASTTETREILQELSQAQEIVLMPEVLYPLQSRMDAEHGAELDEPVARLGDVTFRRRDLGRWLMHLFGESIAPRFVEQHVIANEARRAGQEVSAQEIRQRITGDIELRIERLHRGDRRRWLAQLERRGRSEPMFVREEWPGVRSNLLALKLYGAEREVERDAVLSLWHERYGFGGKSLEARMLMMEIRIPQDEDSGPDELQQHIARECERIVAQLEGLRKRIEAGEDFATLAREHSDDPTTRENGGLLEEGFKLERWPDEVAQSVDALLPGGVSPPLKIRFRYFIFQLLRRRNVPFEEVSEVLRTELEAARIPSSELAAFISSRVATATFEVRPAMFR